LSLKVSGVPKPKGWKVWRTCTFQGLGSKRQEYLDLLSDGIVRWGFQRLGKDKDGGLLDEWTKGRDLLLGSPEGYRISLRAISVNGNLRVGFVHDVIQEKGWRIRGGSIASIVLAGLITLFSVYLIRYFFPYEGPPSLGLALLIIPFSILIWFILFYMFVGRNEITWRRRLKRLLVETAESMGGKQVSPFKKTTVELED